jgi:hypothetical protein
MSAGCRIARWQNRAGKPTHKITAIRTFAFPGPSIKLPPAETLVMGPMLTVRARTAPSP